MQAAGLQCHHADVGWTMCAVDVSQVGWLEMSAFQCQHSLEGCGTFHARAVVLQCCWDAGIVCCGCLLPPMQSCNITLAGHDNCSALLPPPRSIDLPPPLSVPFIPPSTVQPTPYSRTSHNTAYPLQPTPSAACCVSCTPAAAMSAPLIANGSGDSSLAKEGVRLLLTNQFSAAKQMYDTQFNADPKVALLHSFLSYGNAISSYSEADLKACIESCKRTNTIGEKLEKTGKSTNDPAKKIEGMLIQADCDLLTALIMLVEETYVKMMWNMRKSFQGYREVSGLVEKYNGPHKAELSGWVKFGTGMFDVLLSQLPPSIMTIAEMIGFKGDRDRGLKLLTECQEGPSFNAPFAGLLLLVYYLTIAPLTGDEIPGGMDHAKAIIDVRAALTQHTAQQGSIRVGQRWSQQQWAGKRAERTKRHERAFEFAR